jgi:hypothetical protein
MKRTLIFLIAIIFISSCNKDYKVYPAKEYTVASERGCCAAEYNIWEPYFFVKEKGKSTWDKYDNIQGFDYERGYEYRIKAEKIKDMSLAKIADGPSPIYLRLVKVLSSEKKDTEGLPDNALIYSEELPPPSEYFPHAQ